MAAETKMAVLTEPRSAPPLLGRVVQLLLALVFITPVLFMVTGAFRPDEETFRYSATLSINTFIPSRFTLDAFYLLAERDYFYRQLGNTVIVGLILGTTTTLVAALAAYPLARLRFRGRDQLFFLIVATVFIPLDVIIVPLFIVVRDLGWLNTLGGLLLPWIFSPLSIYLMRQSMQDIPLELEEAAVVDGANFFQILGRIILPNVIPTLITIWLLNFIWVWDWFLWPLTVMQDAENQLVQVGIVSLFNPMVRTNYSLVFAASLVAIGTAFVIFVALQRFFLQTFVFTGSK